MAKKRKRANGTGSIFKQKGNLRRPYKARITTDYDERGYPVYETLGTFSSYAEALSYLEDYNRRPEQYVRSKLTLRELYGIFEEKRLVKMAVSSRGSITSAFSNCKPLHDVPYGDINNYMIQELIYGKSGQPAAQVKLRNLFNHLNALAFELGMSNDKIRPEFLKTEKTVAKEKTIFTDEEIARVCEFAAGADDIFADAVVFFLYSGMRFSELLELKSADVDLAAGVMRGGLKTQAGRNRLVPLHGRLLPIVEKRLADGGECLFCVNGKPLAEPSLRKGWGTVLAGLGQKHTPHEARHTFISRLHRAGADRVAIDKIVGHKSGHVGEDTYTHLSVEDLKRAVELLA